MDTGVELIAAERARQVAKEGWTPEHDDEHADGSLALAAACYAVEGRPTMLVTEREDHSGGRGEGPVWKDVQYRVPRQWPASWHASWWKPKDRIRDLVRAGALIAAEIDRLQRAKKSDV